MGPPPPPTKKKRFSLWKILLLIVAIPVGLAASLLGCGMLYDWTATDLPVTAQDRGVVVTAEAFIPFMDEDFAPDVTAETFTKKQFIDDATELEYEYEHPDEDETLYIYCSVTLEPTAKDARISYAAIATGGDIGFSISDVEKRERADLFSGPGKFECGILFSDGEPVGNWLSCLVGKKVFVLTIVGIYFDEPDALESLVGPVMDRLRTYSP